jgi:uncharacterized protein (TIGR01777 family)
VSERHFTWESTLPYSQEDVFAWHERPGAFARLNPPWRPVSVVSEAPSLHDGSFITLKLPLLGPINLEWTLEHFGYRPPDQFCDRQISGPFTSWEHRHLFAPRSRTSSSLQDEITFKLPWLFAPAVPFIKAELARLFTFRHQLLRADMDLHARFTKQKQKKILISGSSGFIGTALTAFLETAGHSVFRLVRREPQTPQERRWNPSSGQLSPDALDDMDAVIHLGGENLFGHRWTPEFKEKIKKSRVDTTLLLCKTIAHLRKKPDVVIIASATGFYGETGSTQVDEKDPAGTGFLADTCRAWENASSEAIGGSCRLVHLRLGTVLSPGGGALQKMLPPFKAGFGGILGSGDQYMSWISLHDLLGIFEYALHSDSMNGPHNAVAPIPVTNREFTKTLGKVLHRPTLVPAPAFVLRGVFGEIADALLLSSSRVVPAALLARGYSFQHPSLENALRFELGLPST